MKNTLPEAEALEFLRRIDAGEVQLDLVGGPIEYFQAIVRYRTTDGWDLAVFNDVGEWDYLEWIESPDGRRWEWDAASAVGEPITELQEYQPLEDVQDSVWHWNKMEMKQTER